MAESSNKSDVLTMMESEVENFAIFIQRKAVDLISPGGPEIAPCDRALLVQSLEILHCSCDELRKGLNLMRAYDRENVEDIYACIRSLMAAVFIIGQSGVLTNEALKNMRTWQLALGRFKKQQKKQSRPEEIALVAAIKAVQGNAPVPKPSSRANQILPKINKRLKDGGYAEVSVDRVRRRLEKFPRS